MKLFQKTKNYYHAPDYEQLNKIVNTKDFKQKDAEDFLNGHVGNDIRYLHHNWFLTTERKDNQLKVLTELPFGTYLHKHDQYPFPERLIPSPVRSGENYLNLSSLDDLHKDINMFLDSKAVFEELNHAYRRGYLLYGSPGNGKTALIRELSKRFDKTAHIIWCSVVPSPAMVDLLNKLPSLKIVIYEEIVSRASGPYFDMGEFLEFMDGEKSINNCITIATTNYPEKLEENLANRPSRFDMVYDVKHPGKKVCYEILSNILKRPVDEQEVDLKNVSFAQIKEIALLHKLYRVSLEEAFNKVNRNTDVFKRGFEEKKTLGFTSEE